METLSTLQLFDEKNSSNGSSFTVTDVDTSVRFVVAAVVLLAFAVAVLTLVVV